MLEEKTGKLGKEGKLGEIGRLRKRNRVIVGKGSGELLKRNCRSAVLVLAEAVGFEPTVPFGTTVFKTAAFNHSATPPRTICKDTTSCRKIAVFSLIFQDLYYNDAHDTL